MMQSLTLWDEEKKSELDTVTIKNDTLRKYFPRSYTPRQMEEHHHQAAGSVATKKQQRAERTLTYTVTKDPMGSFSFAKIWRKRL